MLEWHTEISLNFISLNVTGISICIEIVWVPINNKGGWHRFSNFIGLCGKTVPF